ncbi:basic salivary proline-rich protein 4-like [Penaeus chinensis]|uniref:basic salivary proline-rich protein 4-like n=1 Tax=Penaeus chinensis TaxID=139456 RepID=UPI001FB756E1|nr:basic salivary proline-rich protein 4-like [Penaeus chinensis]
MQSTTPEAKRQSQTGARPRKRPHTNNDTKTDPPNPLPPHNLKESRQNQSPHHDAPPAGPIPSHATAPRSVRSPHSAASLHVQEESSGVRRRWAKSNQGNPNQGNPNQVKSSKARPKNKAQPSETKPTNAKTTQADPNDAKTTQADPKDAKSTTPEAKRQSQTGARPRKRPHTNNDTKTDPPNPLPPHNLKESRQNQSPHHDAPPAGPIPSHATAPRSVRSPHSAASLHVQEESSGVRRRWAKSNQGNPNQGNPNQVKSSKARPKNKAQPSETKPTNAKTTQADPNDAKTTQADPKDAKASQANQPKTTTTLSPRARATASTTLTRPQPSTDDPRLPRPPSATAEKRQKQQQQQQPRWRPSKLISSGGSIPTSPCDTSARVVRPPEPWRALRPIILPRAHAGPDHLHTRFVQTPPNPQGLQNRILPTADKNPPAPHQASHSSSHPLIQSSTSSNTSNAPPFAAIP